MFKWYYEKKRDKVLTYFFDEDAGYTQKDFADLEWKSVDTLKKSKALRGYSYSIPKGLEDKKYFWLLKSAMCCCDYEEQNIEILTMAEALSQNNEMAYGMVLDGWWYTHYAEIPSNDYIFKKFYAKDYEDMQSAKRDILDRIRKDEVESEERENAYEEKEKAIKDASFFAQAYLDNIVDIQLNFESFPVIFKEKEVGKGTLIEYKDSHIHIAVKINEGETLNLVSQSINCEYDTVIENIDNIDTVVKIKSMIISDVPVTSKLNT